MRRIQAAAAFRNSAHKIIASFAHEEKLNYKVHLITQNVDFLHQRADQFNSLDTICMHGSLHESPCTSCQTVYFDDYAYFDKQGNYPLKTLICAILSRKQTSL